MNNITSNSLDVIFDASNFDDDILTEQEARDLDRLLDQDWLSECEICKRFKIIFKLKSYSV